jgi:hypothetical protein
MLYSAVTYNVGPTGTNFSLFISPPTLSLSSTTFPIGRGTEKTLQRRGARWRNRSRLSSLPVSPALPSSSSPLSPSGDVASGGLRAA